MKDSSIDSLSFPGWGTAERIENLDPNPEIEAPHHEKLGEWSATAICGNDITSSCLYVSAIAAMWAGPLAPVALFSVALILFLFRFIYAEVGGALPLNGGAYNVLLNTTSKRWAAVAACLTLLSYMATAVISAGEAMHYVDHILAGPKTRTEAGVHPEPKSPLAPPPGASIQSKEQAARPADTSPAATKVKSVDLMKPGQTAKVRGPQGGVRLMATSAQFHRIVVPEAAPAPAPQVVPASHPPAPSSSPKAPAKAAPPPAPSSAASAAVHSVSGLAFYGTFLLLGFFAYLNLIGISESAKVALGIFLFHIATLVMLVLVCGSIVVANPETFWANWSLPASQWGTKISYTDGALWLPLFFGFSAAMLGVSGFESSANFIEEQDEGVFPKTLRNMWIAVAFFNPMISLLTLGMMPLAEIGLHQNSLLAQMGLLAGNHLSGVGPEGASSLGKLLSFWVSCDAFLVLSGAVLTSYVGVIGLVRRMSLDLCMPQFLLQTNAWKGTNHWIILLFFGLCSSIQVITHGDIAQLAGVYTLSFLSVMALFAIGNGLLKIHRDRLPREVRAPWAAVYVATVAVLVAWYGNYRMDPRYFEVFMTYFLVSLAVVGVMFFRVQILVTLLRLLRRGMEAIQSLAGWIEDEVVSQAKGIHARQIVFFVKGDDPEVLNNAARYVLENEEIRHLKVVHCYQSQEEIPVALGENLHLIDRCYPSLKIDLLLVHGDFGPALIESLSKRLDVPKNYMFLGTPGDHFPHQISELGGVRLIM